MFSGTVGLVFTQAADTRAEGNRFREAVGIETTNGVNPESMGLGDLANITY